MLSRHSDACSPVQHPEDIRRRLSKCPGRVTRSIESGEDHRRSRGVHGPLTRLSSAARRTAHLSVLEESRWVLIARRSACMGYHLTFCSFSRVSHKHLHHATVTRLTVRLHGRRGFTVEAQHAVSIGVVDHANTVAEAANVVHWTTHARRYPGRCSPRERGCCCATPAPPTCRSRIG